MCYEQILCKIMISWSLLLHRFSNYRGLMMGRGLEDDLDPWKKRRYFSTASAFGGKDTIFMSS